MRQCLPQPAPHDGSATRQGGVFVGQIALQPGAPALPQLAQIGGQLFIVQQVVAQLFHALGIYGIGLQAFNQTLHGIIKRLTQTMIRVMRNILQQAVERTGNHAGPLVAEPVGGQHFFLDGVLALEPHHNRLRNQHMGLLLPQHAADASQHIVEHLLVAPARRQP